MPNRRRQLRNQIVAWIRGHKVLATLLVLGFMLRITNVTWGIPLSEFSSFYHGDEVKVWGSTVDFPENYLSSENYLYGTAINVQESNRSGYFSARAKAIPPPNEWPTR